ncbi:hypothetical protein BJX70DRAFT_358799 [Aspergillus crustosus]
MQFTKTTLFTFLAATSALATPFVRRDISCADNGGGNALALDAAACYTYLNELGSASCGSSMVKPRLTALTALP